jgi:hypothetical protein
MTTKRRKHNALHDFFFPHKGNGYKPHVFRKAGITAILVGIIALEAIYLAQVTIIQPRTNFLASVLPGALTMLTNADRTANNLPTVTENAQLAKAAQMAAEDMASKGYFSHVSPDGKDPWYWLKQVGYEYQYSGQNLAVNFSDSDQVETAWMNSPTHRANIVKPQYTEIGIGVANGKYEGKDATFVVQFFASPASGSASTATPTKTVAAATSQTVTPAGAPKTDTKVLGAKTSGPPTVRIAAAPAVPTPNVVEARAPKSALAVTVEKTAAGASTSPVTMTLYALAALGIFLLILLATAVSARMRAPYLEVLGGGLFLVVLCGGLIWFNFMNMPKLQLSDGTETRVNI